MATSRKPGEGQEPLTVVNGSEQLVSSEALPIVPEAASVDLIERAVHLSGVLARFDAMPGQEDWLQAARRPNSPLRRNLFSDSADKANDIISGRQKAYEAGKSEALDMFGRAFGEHVLIETGLATADEATDLKLADYRRFEAHFRGIGQIRVVRRASYRKYLGGVIAANRVETTAVETAQPVNLTAKVSLARMLRPDFLGLKRYNYADITPEVTLRFTSDKIRKHLLNVDSRTENAVAYTNDPLPSDPPGRPRMSTVVMSPLSLKVSHSLLKLAGSTYNDSLLKQQGIGGKLADTGKPNRAGVHAVKKRKAGIEKYQANVIGKSLTLIDQFSEALNHNAGLARFGSEYLAREKLIQLQTETFGEMLSAAGVNMKLLPEEHRLIVRSVEKSVYFAATPAKRRENFSKLITLARDWRNAQNDLFKTIVLTCNSYLDKHDTEA